MSAPSVIERVKTTLVALKMPRALEVLDVTLRGIERGEIGNRRGHRRPAHRRAYHARDPSRQDGGPDGGAVGDQDPRRFRLRLPAIARQEPHPWRSPDCSSSIAPKRFI